ncbi:MAG: hypothetical protein ACM3XN_01960 [Chloroflexota bacterium]
MRTVNWAVVWSDAQEVDKIAAATRGQLRKWRDELNRSEVRLHLPLDFGREADLGEALKALSRNELLSRVDRRRPLKPFVAMLESHLSPVFNTPAVYRCRWRFLLDSGLLSSDTAAELAVLLRLPEFELERRLSEGMFLRRAVGQSDPTDDKYVAEARRLNPDIDRLLQTHVFEQKPTITGRFGASDFLVYTCTAGPLPPLIYFPEAARDGLPHAGQFAARVIGSVNYASNPPAPGLPNLVLRAAILYLPVT